MKTRIHFYFRTRKEPKSRGSLILGTLQTCKDNKSFEERVKNIEANDERVAEYLRKTRSLSVKFSKLTEMKDSQANALPVVKRNAIKPTETLIYNRINKCGSSTLLSTHLNNEYIHSFSLSSSKRGYVQK